jgi:molecular chaperone DnaK
MAGNVLDTALQKFILEKSALVPDSEEYRAAAMAIRRDRRLYKEQLFKTGSVVVALPTDENVTVTLKEFQEFAPVKTFSQEIRDMVSRSAILAAGDAKRINLVATGGGATLPIISELAREGVTYESKHVNLTLRDSVPTRVRETNPELIEPYPQIAVAVGGALPELPSLYREVPTTPTNAPQPAGLAPFYKKEWGGS